MSIGKCRGLCRNRIPVIFALIIGIVTAVMGVVGAQEEHNSPSLELGIIVTPTVDQADKVIKAFEAGTDFGVLAKENSIDSTADDGGYLGRMSPVQLQPELRDAVNAIKTGEISRAVRVPNGFAVLTILSMAPRLQQVDAKRLNSLVASGAVRTSFDVSGFSEAEAAFTDFPKSEGWDRDLHKICEIRTQSRAAGIARVQTLLPTLDPTSQDAFRAHMMASQLHASNGKMEESIQDPSLMTSRKFRSHQPAVRELTSPNTGSNA